MHAASSIDPEMALTDRKAPFVKRVLARLMDASLIAIPAAALAAAGELNAGLETWLIVVGVELVYFFVLEAIVGQTLGKQIMGLAVARADGTRAGVLRVAARTVVRVLDDNPIGLLVMLLTGKRRQRLGDLVAGSVVARHAARA